MRSLVLALALALAAVAPAGATYPGRDGRIAFFASAGCGRYSLPADPCNALAFRAVLAVAPRGRDAVPLARCPGPTCATVLPGGPRYSPDGRLIAVIGSLTSPAQLAILRSDGSEAQRIDVPATSLAGVDWLPDGRLVAYAFPERGGSASRTFLIGADGVAHEVVWRPKGGRAWSSRGDVAIGHDRGIYVWDRRSGVRHLILPNGRRFRYGLGDWSPDGRRLVVVRQDLLTQLWTIVTVAADGGERRVVVRAVSPGCPFSGVAWSPSGARIAYLSGCYDVGAIYSVRTDGAVRRTIFEIESLGGAGSLETYMGREISWQPLRP
jgi:dipeptidyl aminopeptidase/acylaminoacyl peptidase